MTERGAPATILVVDDQEDLRRLLVLALRRHDERANEQGVPARPSDSHGVRVAGSGWRSLLGSS